MSDHSFTRDADEPISLLPDEDAPIRRRWRWPGFRFGLRTLLLGVTLVAVGIGWWKDRQTLEGRVARLEGELSAIRRANAPSWGVDQLIGKPDVNSPGSDHASAWAPLTQDDQLEWLELTYDKSVVPTTILIHETYCPGAVYKVSVFDRRGREVVVWTGTDPTPTTAASGVSRIPVTVSFRVSKVKVYLDSPRVPGWNEIDAVGMRDANGTTIWAAGADASSSYGSRYGARGYDVRGYWGGTNQLGIPRLLETF